jgi:hypothetical protein
MTRSRPSWLSALACLVLVASFAACAKDDTASSNPTGGARKGGAGTTGKAGSGGTAGTTGGAGVTGGAGATGNAGVAGNLPDGGLGALLDGGHLPDGLGALLDGGLGALLDGGHLPDGGFGSLPDGGLGNLPDGLGALLDGGLGALLDGGFGGGTGVDGGGFATCPANLVADMTACTPGTSNLCQTACASMQRRFCFCSGQGANAVWRCTQAQTCQ